MEGNKKIKGINRRCEKINHRQYINKVFKKKKIRYVMKEVSK